MLESLFQHLTAGRVVLGGILLLVIFDVLSRLTGHLKIRKVGLRAPSRAIPWPFGLDVAYHGIRSARNNRVYEFFQDGTANDDTLAGGMLTLEFSYGEICESQSALYS